MSVPLPVPLPLYRIIRVLGEDGGCGEVTEPILVARHDIVEVLSALLPRLALVCETCNGSRIIVRTETISATNVSYTHTRREPCDACKGRGFTRLGAEPAKEPTP